MSLAFVEKTPWRGYLVLSIAYALALAAGIAVGVRTPPAWHPLTVMVMADLAATATLFVFAFAFNCTALFNAHWSLLPLAVGMWFVFGPGQVETITARQLLVLVVVGFYGLRLTFNWVRSWAGLAHEDWQYTDFRAKTGKAFWWVSFLAFHLFPMGLVLLGSLPLHPALVAPTREFGLVDVLAALVAVAAVIVEWVADEQLRAFRRSASGAGRFCNVGLWRWSRHPNYFGEVTFWFGLWLCGMAAGGAWWTAGGWVGMAGLFLGASIPMAEKRSLERRAGYAEYAVRTSLFVPLPPTKG